MYDEYKRPRPLASTAAVKNKIKYIIFIGIA